MNANQKNAALARAWAADCADEPYTAQKLLAYASFPSCTVAQALLCAAELRMQAGKCKSEATRVDRLSAAETFEQLARILHLSDPTDSSL